MRKLLAGTGLGFEVTEDSVVLIKPSKQGAAAVSEVAVLETINVFGTLDNELSIGSKSGQTLCETPKSVTIVGRERIEIQNLTSLKDILNQATGVTVSSYGPVDNWYYSRGFEVALDRWLPGHRIRLRSSEWRYSEAWTASSRARVIRAA